MGPVRQNANPDNHHCSDYVYLRERGGHQLDHMQIICTSLQTDNHASTSPLSFCRPDAIPATQPTVSNHWRHTEQLCSPYKVAQTQTR